MLSQDFPPTLGGIQTYALELARRFARTTEDFLMVAPGGDATATCDRNLDFEVRRLGPSPELLPAVGMAVVPWIVRRRRFDRVLYCQWQTGVISAFGPMRGPRARYAVAAHGNELLLAPAARLPTAQRAYDGLRARVLRGAQRILCVSHFTADLARRAGAPPERIRVVPNGTDPERFRPLDATPLRRALGLEGRRVLLSIGRLTPRKGFDTVIEALPEVLAGAPDVAYVLAGEGEDRGRLEALARERGVADRVRFLGRIDGAQVALHYNLAEVFVTPSRQEGPSVEGFGIVFLEANACGKPVIGARSGGVSEAILDGETGLLVEPNDRRGLASAVLRLLGDPALGRRLGERGRQRVLAEGSWDAVHARVAAELQTD
jgi:phosphatidylinositol alpha-1,6-mannosyltransferase